MTAISHLREMLVNGRGEGWLIVKLIVDAKSKQESRISSTAWLIESIFEGSSGSLRAQSNLRCFKNLLEQIQL